MLCVPHQIRNYRKDITGRAIGMVQHLFVRGVALEKKWKQLKVDLEMGKAALLALRSVVADHYHCQKNSKLLYSLLSVGSLHF